jgi:hypothetical protein
MYSNADVYQMNQSSFIGSRNNQNISCKLPLKVFYIMLRSVYNL